MTTLTATRRGRTLAPAEVFTELTDHTTFDRETLDPQDLEAEHASVQRVASPTEQWLAAAGLLPLEGPAGTAERLLLLIHYGVNWDGWIVGYRDRYWAHLLPDRVFCATFQASTLRRWWRDVAQDIDSAPRSKAERDELEVLLREDPQPVLRVLREETEALLLRTRITADAVRAARPPRGATA